MTMPSTTLVNNVDKLNEGIDLPARAAPGSSLQSLSYTYPPMTRAPIAHEDVIGSILQAQGEGTTVTPEQAAVPSHSDLQSAIICLAGFTIIFTACGTLFAFGVYQDLYQQLAQEPHTPFTGASPALIDLIGTLSVALMTIFGPYTTAWAKVFSPSLVIASGGVLFGISCVLASFGTRLWHFELTQGFLLGVATCLSYMPAVTVTPTWYGRRRGLAMGIILSGTGVGGVVWAPATTALIDSFGFRNALRITGSITGTMIVLASFAIKWDPTTKQRLDRERAARQRGGQRVRLYQSLFVNVKLLDLEVAKSRIFLVQLIGTFLQAAAYYTPVFFFSAYARSTEAHKKSGTIFATPRRTPCL